MSQVNSSATESLAEPEMSGLAVYIRLLKYLRNLKFPFFLSIIGFIIFAASQPTLAKMMEMIIEAIEQQNAEARWTLPLLAIGVFALRGVGHFMGTYYNGYVGATFIKNLKTEVFDHVSALPASFYDNQLQGKLLHRMNQRCQQDRGGCNRRLPRRSFEKV